MCIRDSSRQVAEERKDKLRRALIKDQQKTTLDDLFSQISAGQIKDLNLIIKADVQGSVEAVRQSLEKLSNDCLLYTSWTNCASWARMCA